MFLQKWKPSLNRPLEALFTSVDEVIFIKYLMIIDSIIRNEYNCLQLVLSNYKIFIIFIINFICDLKKKKDRKG